MKACLNVEMKVRDPLVAILAATLVPGPLLAACQSLPSEKGPALVRRAGSGAPCGPTAGNAICDAGLCCSENGICGTGGAFCSGPACQLSYGPACDGNQIPAGTDTSKTPRPLFGSIPYGVDISHCSVKGKVALTFDDGPYIYTTELLDLLKRNNVPATFFVVGNNAGKGQINDPKSGYTPIIQRMIADGHQVGSHTWSHQDLNAMTPQQRKAQIVNNEIALSSILGVIPTYLRPPYTSCGADCYNDLKSFGYHVVNYDIDTRDWENGGVNAKSIYQNILAQQPAANSQWLTLAHDVQEFTVHELAQFMIDKAKAAGYDLVTVGACLGDPPGNWYRDPGTGAARDARGASPSSNTQAAAAATNQRVATASKSSTTETEKKAVTTPTPTPVSQSNFHLGAGSTAATKTTSTSAGLLGPSSTAAVASPRVPGVVGLRAAPAPTFLAVLGGGSVVLGLLLGFLGVALFMAF